jgi:hypothetical protein
VFDLEGRSCLLEIPVKWQRRSGIKCIPNVISFDHIEIKGKSVDCRILAIVPDGQQDRGIETVLLVPWIRLTNCEQHGRAFDLHLQVDCQSIPKSLNQPIARVHVRSDERSAEILGHR